MEDIIASRMNSVSREKAALYGGMMHDPRYSRRISPYRSMVKAAGGARRKKKAGSKTAKRKRASSKSAKYSKTDLMKKKKSSLIRMILKMKGGNYASGVSAGAHKRKRKRAGSKTAKRKHRKSKKSHKKKSHKKKYYKKKNGRRAGSWNKFVKAYAKKHPGMKGAKLFRSAGVAYRKR